MVPSCTVRRSSSHDNRSSRRVGDRQAGRQADRQTGWSVGCVHVAMCGMRCDSPRRVVHLVGFVLQYTKKKRVCVCVCMGRMHNAKHCSREEESVCVIVKRSSLLFYPPHSFNIYKYIYQSAAGSCGDRIATSDVRHARTAMNQQHASTASSIVVYPHPSSVQLFHAVASSRASSFSCECTTQHSTARKDTSAHSHSLRRDEVTSNK